MRSQSLLHLFRFLCKSLKSSPRFLLVSLPNRFHVPFLGIFEIPEEFWVDLKINMRIGNVTQREFNFAKTITTSNMRLEYITYSTKYTHSNIACFSLVTQMTTLLTIEHTIQSIVITFHLMCVCVWHKTTVSLISSQEWSR